MPSIVCPDCKGKRVIIKGSLVKVTATDPYGNKIEKTTSHMISRCNRCMGKGKIYSKEVKDGKEDSKATKVT